MRTLSLFICCLATSLCCARVANAEARIKQIPGGHVGYEAKLGFGTSEQAGINKRLLGTPITLHSEAMSLHGGLVNKATGIRQLRVGPFTIPLPGMREKTALRFIEHARVLTAH